MERNILDYEMRKNLTELQSQMKARNANAANKTTEMASSIGMVNNHSVSSDNNSGSIVVEQNVPLPQRMSDKPLCSHCKRRVCREGTALCSRCTGTGIQEELRDVLPGMEIKREIIPMRITSATVHPTESYKYHLPAPVEQVVIVKDDTKVNYYTRREVANMIGTSSTSICRWEQKGRTPRPIQFTRNGPLYYSEEHVQILREYKNTVTINQPRPATPENQQHDAAKFVAKKTFKLNRGLERAVATRLGRGGLGSGKLL